MASVIFPEAAETVRAAITAAGASSIDLLEIMTPILVGKTPISSNFQPRGFARRSARGCLSDRGGAGRSIQAASPATAASSVRVRAVARTFDGTQSGKGTSFVT